MAIPVQLEIFMKDLTKAGLQSVGKNVDDVETQTRQLISALQQVIAEQKHQLEVNKTAGISYTQEAANIQALTGQVRGLEAGLKELKKTKEETAKTQPIDIDTEAVTRKTNNLKMQFSQVARELPSLAMGPQMFILAISNNLPMLADAIADVRKQNELLAASGQKGVPVWKQLASSVFSWQTALVAAISLGIVFGKDIMDWVSKITKGKDAALSLADAQKKVNEAFDKDSGDVGEQAVRIKSLSTQWKNLGDNLEEKKRFIKGNKDELDKLGVSVSNVNDAENLLAKNTEQYIQAMSLRAQAASAFKLATEAAETAIKKQVQINQEEKKSPSFMDRFLSVLSGTGASSTWSSRSTEEATAEQRQQTRINGMKEEKKAAEETEKAYTELFTTLSNQAKKVLNDAGISESDNKEETKIAKTDYASQLADARVKAQQTTEKLRLQIMMEGIAKRKALAKQEYDEQLADIDKQERDTLVKMDKSRKQGDNIPQSQYESVRQEAQTQRILAQQVLNKKLLDIDNEYQNKAIEAQITYNKQYGTYAEQRAAIIAEGLRKAAKAENDGSRKLILRQTEDALKQLDFKRFKDSINFADVFSNLDTQTNGTLNILRDKLKEYINNAAGELDPEDLKELQDAFQKIDFKIAERNPFGELKTGLKEYKSAQEAVNKAQKDLDTVMQGGAVITGMYMDENGKLVSRLLSVEQAERNLSEAQSNRQQVLTKLTAAANSIGTQGLQVVNVGSQIVDMLESFGIKMPEAVSNTLNGLGQVMSGLESIDLTKPFSAITGSLDILTGIGNTISGLLGFGGADYSGYEEMKSRYEGLIDIWDTLIDKKTEYIDIDYGTEAQKAAEEAIKLTETQIERQRQLANMLASSGASVGSHSLGYRVNDRMSSQDWQRLSGLVGQQVDSLDDVLKLDTDVIGKVLQDEKFVNVLTTVNSDFIEYIQNIEKYGEQLEEIANKEQEAITGIGFDAFRDGYVDLISDLESTNEDLADNLEKNLQNAFFRSLIADKYNSQIKALYDNWVKMGENGLTKDEVEVLRNQNQAMIEQMLKDREELMETFGWQAESSSGSSQSPSSGALTTMSQDSISAFEGIGRNMQTHLANVDRFVQELRETQKLDSETLATIASHTAYIVLIYDLMEDMKLNGIKMQ
jgi:hypothetical protein